MQLAQRNYGGIQAITHSCYFITSTLNKCTNKSVVVLLIDWYWLCFRQGKKRKTYRQRSPWK